MEDYITRASKARGAIEAILAGLFKMSDTASQDEIRDYVTTELDRSLGIDLTSVLANPGFIAVLVSDYGFEERDLDKFAQILYSMLKSDDGSDEVHNSYAKAIVAINKWLEDKNISFSKTRHYVLEEMNRYF